MSDVKCELCNDTGYYGDNGPGIKGNNEYSRCECRSFDNKPTRHNQTQELLKQCKLIIENSSIRHQSKLHRGLELENIKRDVLKRFHEQDQRKG